MDKTPAIEVRGLTKVFGAKKALSDVSFTVARGAIFGFLGPNGAGKTTTIRCLMDFIRPTDGSVLIFGKDATKHSTELKELIGFLPSDMQLNQKWTVGDHLRLAQAARGRKLHFPRLLADFELDKRTRVKSLSTGNKQKLSILLAFAGQPQLLVMDEPTRGLDPMLQNILYELLRDFVKDGGTVFFSSHNLSEVQRMCDTVVLIKNGKIVTEQGMEDIRGANVHVVEAVTKQAMKRSELTRRNVEVVMFDPHRVSLKVEGSLSPTMAYLAKAELLDLSVTHVNLEDIFLEKYKEQSV